MLVRIQFMGPLRRLLNEEETVVDLVEGSTVDDAIRSVVTRYPLLGSHTGALLAAINEEWVESSARIPPGAGLVLMPPVSGG